MPDETHASTPLDEILASYIAGEESGQPLDRQELLARHPQFAAELREFFANRDQIQRLAQPLRAPAATRRAGNHPLGKIRYFGDYEILEEIAAGGMGIVYKARQVSLNRIVAVKMILKGTLASEDDVKRFKAEAEAAASLQHSAIVAIHEVGLHDGQHYFSMDYVEGQSLAQLARERPLSARQAAQYIRDSAEAVHCAHQQGTLHRDLKPSNILIDRQGRIRITDFGLAKKISGNSDLTLTGQILGTPSYMPPEQASGKRSLVAAPSDVYSLGAVLYELLCGRPPFRGELPAETLRQVETLDPISPRLLSPTVPRDLETVCLKCLEKEPHKRYGTAQLLADDLSRYLRGEGVLARPPSAAYRFAKFARRNRTGLSIAGLIVLFVVLLGGVVGWMVRDREAERVAFEQRISRDRAVRLAKTAEDIQLALQEAQTLGDRALKLVNDNPYQWEATLEAALAACKRADAFAEPNRSTLDPALLARLAQLSERLNADEQDRQFVARIDAIRMEATQVDLQRSEFKGGEQSLKVESLLGSRGIEFGAKSAADVVAWIQARPEAIQPHVLAAFDIWLAGQAARTSEQRQWLTDVLRGADSDAWRTEARRAVQARDIKALEKLVGDAPIAQQPAAFLNLLAMRLPPESESIKLDLFKQIQTAYPNDFWANEHYALSLSAANPPRWTEAARFHTAAIALRPDNPGVYLNLGQALEKAGDLDGAAAALRRAVEIAPSYAGAWNNLGNVLKAKGELDNAVDAIRRAIRLDAKNVLMHDNLGRVLQAKGDLDDAIEVYREAIRIDANKAILHRSLGNALNGRHDVDGAIAEFREAIRLDPNYALAHNGLGVALRAKGDLEGAIIEFREMIRLDPKSVAGHINLGALLYDKRDFDGAVAACREAVRLDPKIAEAHNNLGNALEEKGDLEGALAEFREATRLEPKLAQPHINLGKMLHLKGELDGAILEYREAIRLDPASFVAFNNLGAVFLRQRRPDEAERMFQEAIRHNKNFAAAYDNLGNALAEQLKWEPANNAYRQAIRLKPDFAQAHADLGQALRTQGKLDEAIASLREAMRLDPNFIVAAHNLGMALATAGQSEEATKYLTLAQELLEKRAADHADLPAYRADLARHHFHMGMQHKSEGRDERAEKVFQTALSLLEPAAAGPKATPFQRQEYARALNELGRLYFDRGEYDAAQPFYQKATSLREKLVEGNQASGDLAVELGGSYCNLGHLLLLQDEEDFEAAIDFYHKAITLLEPWLASNAHISTRKYLFNAYQGLAEAYFAWSKYPEAARVYDQAVAISPAPLSAGSRSRRALFLACAGEHERAAAEAEALAASKPSVNVQVVLAEVWASAADAPQLDAGASEQYARRAVAAIRAAIARGYQDREYLQDSPHLESLQNRPDFQRVLDQSDSPKP